MFDEIIRLIEHVDPYVYCKGYPKSIQQDKATFEKWNCGMLTTREAIACFLANNNQPKDTHVDIETFRKWMVSLGYIRRKND